MIPARPLLWLVLFLLLAGLLPAWWPPALTLWYGAALALLLLAVLDAWAGWRVPALRLERQLAGVWAVDNWHPVHLTVHNDEQRRLRLCIMDDYPTRWALEGLPLQLQLDAGAWISCEYRLHPCERGDAHFGPAWVRVASPLGLWWMAHRLGPEHDIKVFPDFSQLLGASLQASDRRTPVAGALRRRRRGEGTDFRQLREYRQGDSLRAIDWKATARQLKPISREYQEERDQQVVFLLDAGRRMLARDGDMAHFDHALHAVLTLAFVAQKQGDAVGLLTFGAESRWLSPLKGRTGLDRLLAGIYDVQAQEVAPDYTQAAQDLLRRLHKRAFVVLITNVRDEDDTAMRTAVELLSRKHLVLCASLRERALDEALLQPVHTFQQALRTASSALYLRQRREAIRRLHLRPGHLIDIQPQELSRALIDRYLDIKESGQL